MRTLAEQPLGRFLVIAIAIGLLAMAIWQAFEAAIGHRGDQGRERLFERLASAGRTLAYLYFAWTAYQVFNHANSSSADKSPGAHRGADGLVRRALGWSAWPGSRSPLLGVGLVIYGVTKRFEKHLKTGQMSPKTRTLSRRLGVAGYSAKGIAYGIAGVLVVTAAVTYDPDKARGLDAALHTLREQAYGTLLLSLVALGIAAFGVFCFVQARYRKV